MNLLITLIKDIVVIDTSGEILNYTCEVLSDGPLQWNAPTLRKHIVNELTRMIYCGNETLATENLSECIQRRLSKQQNIKVVGLTKQ